MLGSPVQEAPCCSAPQVLPASAWRNQPRPRRGAVSPIAAPPFSAGSAHTTHARTVCRSVVTDESVPEGHKGLHGFLYGEAGAEVHDFGSEYVLREGEDDGQYLVNLAQYVSAREADKPVGVYAIYDSDQRLQYVGYSRNIVASLKGYLLKISGEKCAFVRALIIRNKAMTTRDSLEKISSQWLAEAGALPPGNSFEQHIWEGQARATDQAYQRAYEEKKLKMRKAMGEDLHNAGVHETEDTRQRRLNLISAMESDDWSSVIDAQTQATMQNGATPVVPPESEAAAASSWPGPPTRVTPFAQARVHRTIGDTAVHAVDMNVKSVDETLDSVRPYLMADGGNVTVVDVQQGVVFLRLEGACGTCASSTSTMKMGIERALQAAFGEQLKGVEQVDVQNTAASVVGIDGHLSQLRPAIQSYGGSVQVVSVVNGVCIIDYHGPAPIGMGIQAAIKDKFPDIKEVTLIAGPVAQPVP